MQLRGGGGSSRDTGQVFRIDGGERVRPWPLAAQNQKGKTITTVKGSPYSRSLLAESVEGWVSWGCANM